MSVRVESDVWCLMFDEVNFDCEEGSMNKSHNTCNGGDIALPHLRNKYGSQDLKAFGTDWLPFFGEVLRM